MLHLVLGLALAVQSAAPQRADRRTWYQAYADAQRDVQQKNWQAAIADIEAASRLGAPKPGRNVLFYGDVYRDFNPDYYLGVAYLNLNRFDEADRAFERVKQAQLISPKDNLFAEFTRQATTAKDTVEKLAASQRNAPSPPPNAAPDPTPPPATPPSNAVPPNNAVGQANPRIDATLNQPGQQLPNQSPVQQSPIQQTPIQGPPTNVPTRGAANRARPSLAPIVPGNANPPRVTPPSAPLIRVTADERSALVDFFSGNYEGARTKLYGLTATSGASPRAYLYLACSRVALALTGKPDNDNVIAEARADLARAGDTTRLAADKALISPRIRQLLGL